MTAVVATIVTPGAGERALVCESKSYAAVFAAYMQRGLDAALQAGGWLVRPSGRTWYRG